MKIQLPQNVDKIINILRKQGYEAYAVGGCVRDSILGKEPQDWDITTSAKPLEVKELFHRTIDTGIQHGTVTVMLDKTGYEVTTYRIDGEYEDNRHPKTVEFTTNLVEDLRRRDFTINAMAYNEQEGLVDAFGGLEDIKQGMIRCVGSASDRFDEDALRILRAIRFSAQLGFFIDQNTLKAIKDKAENLRNISAERIREELNKLLLSNNPEKLIEAYDMGITKIILPEFDIMMKTEQNNSHHIYSVGIHTMKAVLVVGESMMNHQEIRTSLASLDNQIDIDVTRPLLEESPLTTKEKLILKWTMLLHDVEKPNSLVQGEDGEDHFYGHQERGSLTAKKVLRGLKFDNETTDIVVRLVKWHDDNIPSTPAGMRRTINKVGLDIMNLLFEVKRADILGQNPKTWDVKFSRIKQGIELYYAIKSTQECVSLNMLNINGNKLLEIGFQQGKAMGDVLNQLLEQVLENPKLNKEETLIELAKQFLV